MLIFSDQDFKIWFHYTGVEKKCKETFSKLTSPEIPESDKCGYVCHNSCVCAECIP